MARVLIVFATFDGHTARVSARVAGVLAKDGHRVDLRAVESPGTAEALARCDAVIVAGAIRFGHFAKPLERFVRLHAPRLAALRNAFFCVCLSARKPGGGTDLAKRYVEEFQARTRWTPQRSAAFAGALLYRKYNPLLRWLMRLISALAGGETDTRRDYVYTDWQAVERFAKGFAWSLQAMRDSLARAQ
jgi:menaquinone-dependent protoporphyrinogen oxidase